MIWRRAPEEPSATDGVPTITPEDFIWARENFRAWLLRWGWLAVAPLASGVVALLVGWPMAVAVALCGLAFDILGVWILATPLLDLSVIRWLGTYGGLEVSTRRFALVDREKAQFGLLLIVLGFLLQAGAVIAVVYTSPVSTPATGG